MKPPRICSCGLRVASGARCICQQARKAEADRRRPSARQRGYTTEWQRESKGFLAQPGNRFCACGCGRYADMVDHIRPHRGDHRLFWDRKNWQPLATRCHNSRKQSIERRGLGGDRQLFAKSAGTGRFPFCALFSNSAQKIGAEE